MCVCSQSSDSFTLNTAALEDGKGKCPYDPAKGHTGLIVGEWEPILELLRTVFFPQLSEALVSLPYSRRVTGSMPRCLT